MTTPRISTRKHYDLLYGKTLDTNSYHLYPKKSFSKIFTAREITIMIHGLRNDQSGALKKFDIAKRRLRKLGYRYPLVGFTYDSNTIGAHLKKTQLRALNTGQKIAKKNGKNLGQFILDIKKINPEIKLRLMGHSLGSLVILSTLEFLSRHDASIEAVYFFGASISSDIPSCISYRQIFKKTIRKKIINYYNPHDAVLQDGYDSGAIKSPLGLYGSTGRVSLKYTQRKVKSENHRFASYAKVLNSFP